MKTYFSIASSKTGEGISRQKRAYKGPGDVWGFSNGEGRGGDKSNLLAESTLCHSHTLKETSTLTTE